MDSSRYIGRRSGRQGRDERGFVLVLALVMLAILSILASILMNTSTTELKIVNNYQNSKQAFYAAERAAEYAVNRSILLDLDMLERKNLGTGDGGIHKTRIDVASILGDHGGVLMTVDPNDPTPVTDPDYMPPNMVEDLGAGDLPAKLAAGWGSEFGANQYRVRATAVGPGNSQARIETVIIRIYKNEDESVFRSTGKM